MNFDDLYGKIKIKSDPDASAENPSLTKPVTIYESDNTQHQMFAAPKIGAVDILNLPTELSPQVLKVNNFDELVRSIFEAV